MTLYPPLDKLRADLVEVNNSQSLPDSMYTEEDYLDIRDHIRNDRTVLEGISGPLEISW